MTLPYENPENYKVGKVEGDKRRFFVNKQIALAYANDAAKHWTEQVRSVDAKLEPNHGFVAILYVRQALPEAHDLGFEVQDVTIPAVTETPQDWADKKKTKATPVPGGASSAPSAPKGGTTARVWAIADEKFADVGAADIKALRGAIISACEAEGINKSTAGTQYSKWKRAKGI